MAYSGLFSFDLQILTIKLINQLRISIRISNAFDNPTWLASWQYIVYSERLSNFLKPLYEKSIFAILLSKHFSARILFNSISLYSF